MSFRKHRPYRKAVRMGQTPALMHIRPPQGDEVLDEVLRIVHTKRARKLRKRGVELVKLEPGTWIWFEHPESWLNRKMQRAIVDALAGIRQRPNNMTDADVREIVERGYIVRVLDNGAQVIDERRSPTVELIYRQGDYIGGLDEGERKVGMAPALGAPFEAYNRKDANLYGDAVHHNLSQILPQAEFERIYGKPIGDLDVEL